MDDHTPAFPPGTRVRCEGTKGEWIVIASWFGRDLCEEVCIARFLNAPTEVRVMLRRYLELSPSPPTQPQATLPAQEPQPRAQRQVLPALQRFIQDALGTDEAGLLGWNQAYGSTQPVSDPSFFKVQVDVLQLMAIPGSGFEWVPLYIMSEWARFLREGTARMQATSDPTERARIAARMDEVRSRMPTYNPHHAPAPDLAQQLAR
jgi:hypothetical protein